MEEGHSEDQMFKVEDAEVNPYRKLSHLELEDTGTNLCRRPSLLDLPSVNRRRHGQSRNASRPSSRASQSYDSNGIDIAVLHWDGVDIDSWLDEIDMKEYKSLFKQHAITTGRRLLSLTEEHLKEIGVVKVGHRIELMSQIDGLRKAVGWVSKAAFVDLPTLLNQSVFIIIRKYFCLKFHLFRLDIAKSQRILKLYPKRIIMVRHAEVRTTVSSNDKKINDLLFRFFHSQRAM